MIVSKTLNHFCNSNLDNGISILYWSTSRPFSDFYTSTHVITDGKIELSSGEKRERTINTKVNRIIS